MRRKVLVGNWKMNKNHWQTLCFVQSLLKYTKEHDLRGITLFIAPAYPLLQCAYRVAKGSGIEVAAQDVSPHESGAYTGEVSADMLHSIGIETTIIGHSERRRHFEEGDLILSHKIQRALDAWMEVIYCIGEDAEARRDGRQFEVIEAQLDVLNNFDSDAMACIAVAYEPVWAIGSGQTATPAQAQEMHRYIRGSIADRFSADLASFTTILYGGSLKPENAAAIFAQPDVDGGLVGGAALDPEQFIGVIKGFLA